MNDGKHSVRHSALLIPFTLSHKGLMQGTTPFTPPTHLTFVYTENSTLRHIGAGEERYGLTRCAVHSRQADVYPSFNTNF